MPYAGLTNLPKGIRKSLPEQAQEIYRGVFNRTYRTYADKEDKYDPDDTRQEVAHRVAWAAVKKKYERTYTGWKRREGSK